jgi:hypothetical protein
MIEEIETLEVKTSRYVFNFGFIDCGEYITNLWSNDISEPAIINGKICEYNRKYSKKSFESAMDRISKAKLK